MKVKLIDYQKKALELLLYTKNTRLQGGMSIEEIEHRWTQATKLEHLAYMRDTIKSSWEFVNYTFEISGVTRAFTHQLVRTRNGRYAQESMRTVDVSEAEVMKPDLSIERRVDSQFDTEAASPSNLWDFITAETMSAYQDLIEQGTSPQDARGILPTNVCTSIIAQFSLRTLHEMATVRLCTRTQGEYQDVFRAMKAAVVEVHPWADEFIQVACVNTGVCVFPRYTECPIQSLTYNADGDHEYIIRTIKRKFESIRHEAVPVAKDGMTMSDGDEYFDGEGNQIKPFDHQIPVVDPEE